MRPKQMPMTGSTTRRGQSHSSSSPSHPMRRASLAASAHGLSRTFGRAERTRHGVRSCNWSRNQSSARSISRAAGRADPNCCLYSSRLLARRLVLVVLVLIEEDLTREAASNHMRMLMLNPKMDQNLPSNANGVTAICCFPHLWTNPGPHLGTHP